MAARKAPPEIFCADPRQLDCGSTTMNKGFFFCLKTLRGVRFRDLLFSDEKYFDCNDHECMWEWVLPGETVEPLGRDECAPNVHVWGLIGIGIKVLTTHCSKRGRLPRKVPSTQSPTAEGQAIGPKWSNGAHRGPDQKVP